MEKLLLKPTELAEALGISKSKAYQLISQRKIPGVVRIDKSVRVSRVELEKWIAEQGMISEV